MDILGYEVANLQNVIFFLLPGLLMVLLFYYQVPDRRQSDLTVIFFSVVASVSITYAAALIFTILNILFHFNLSITNPWFEFTKIVLSIILAILLARLVGSNFFGFLNKRVLKVNSYPFGRIWNTFFKLEGPTVFKVSLLDGNSYIGLINRSSFNPNDDIQEIELLDPYSYKRDKGTIMKIKESESVLVPGAAIASIEKITAAEAKKLYILPTLRKRKK